GGVSRSVPLDQMRQRRSHYPRKWITPRRSEGHPGKEKTNPSERGFPIEEKSVLRRMSTHQRPYPLDWQNASSPPTRMTTGSWRAGREGETRPARDTTPGESKVVSTWGS